MRKQEIDHEFTSNIVCPYCGHTHSDSWEYFRDRENIVQDIDCAKCGKSFCCEMDFDVTYITKIKD